MKQGWEIKKLPDVVWFQEGPGVRKHQYTTSGVKLLNVANLVNGKVDLSTSDRYVSEEEAYGKYKHFLADEGDLILASSGIQVEYIEKKMGFVHKEHLPLCMNTSTIRFKPVDKECLNIRYFMYFLKSYNFKAQLYRLITGIAQLNFGPLHLKQMNIPIPPREEQERIVAELDCLSGVIEKKKQQLKELDALAQSIFYQMFGDPITNEKGWKVKKLEELCDIINGFAFPSSDFAECNPIKAIKITNVGVNEFISDDSSLPEEYNNMEGCKVHTGDIVIALTRTIISTGVKRAIVPNEYNESLVNQRVAAILANDRIVSRRFLYSFLGTDFVRQYILQKATALMQPNLSIRDLRDMPTIYPPLTLQQEFADKIEAIEKQKELIKKSISETDTLFNARMDYYFN